MTERRYRDDEVEKIFRLATTQKASSLPASTTAADGLTLIEIQSIGREAGIEADAVALAANALDSPAGKPARTSLGMPISVGVTVPLPRVMTDHEWELLVAELRATFRAKGRITTHGSLREWANGNLRANVEPTESGSRLTLGTLKGSAMGLNVLGGSLALATLASLAAAVALADVSAFTAPLMLGAAATATFMSNSARLKRWRDERQQQMNHIAAKIRAIMGV